MYFKKKIIFFKIVYFKKKIIFFKIVYFKKKIIINIYKHLLTYSGLNSLIFNE